VAWPAELVERFRARRVTLFIGAGCGRSAGLPDWKTLLETLRDRFRDNHIVDDAELQRLRGWWANSGEFPRIAKFFSDRDREFYRRTMQGIFDPPSVPANRKPPRYFHYFPALGVTTIVTTNFDALLEDALTHRRFSELTWQDADEFERFLRDPRSLVFHLHGIASRFGTIVHTLDEYRTLKGPRGRQALDFLGRIIERDTLLFAGYSLSDGEIKFVADQFQQNWKRRPDWYLLAANPTAEMIHHSREENGLMVIPYAPLADTKDSHGAAIDAMFLNLAGRLDIADLGVPPPEASTDFANSVVAVTRDFLREQPPITAETRRQFYRGHEPTWALLRDNAATQRSIVTDIVRRFDGGSQFILLTGAGGEGKSTVLKQVAILLAERGDRVFFAEADETLDLRDLLKRERGKIAILIDDAEDLANAEGLLTFAERRRDPTHLVLGARANEWRERHQTHPRLQRLLEHVTLSRLSDKEISAIAHLIFESGASSADTDEKTLAARLTADTNGFLLAAMLVATEGRPLREILRDVVETISSWNGGDILIKALAVVAAHESRQTPQGHRIFCSQRLFREVMGGISNHRMFQLCNRLTGEVSVSPRGGYRVETRHPVIADVVAQVLFDPTTPLIGEMEVYEWIVRAAGRLSRDEVNPGERKLLTILPLDFKRRGRSADARQLFRAATNADPHDAHSWQAWALMEKEQGNVGDTVTPLSGTARYLFKKGTDADPHNAHLWQAWALTEKEQGNVGDIAAPLPGTARFLFKKGTDTDPHDAHLWQAWALMEKEQGNVGDITAPLPGTARYLFKKGTDADPHDAHLWQAWALMEKEQGNVGDITAPPPGTARYLFKKGTDANPQHAPSWQAWALMELDLEFLVEAMQLCSSGLRNCPGSTELLSAEKRINAMQLSLNTPGANIEKHIQAGDISRAKSELASALAKNPIDPQLLRLATELSQLVSHHSEGKTEPNS
jgi:tetratricopeptide (TPR) repeat protein/energy-coupling factor transporter ATP-binding protein EcfA2